MALKILSSSAALLFGCSLLLAGCNDTTSSRSLTSAQADTDQAPENVLRWGGDSIGGAPYVFRDPNDSSRYIGFEKEIADEIGKRLGRPTEFVQTQWDAMIPALNRGDFDFALSGIEITDERKAQVLFTHPYYVAAKQLVVRTNTVDIKNMQDLKDRPVGTLLASTSAKFLESLHDAEIRTYEDAQRPFDDLVIGRIDAVLLDLPIAEYYAGKNPKMKFVGKPVAPGKYAIAVRKSDHELLQQLNSTLAEMEADGTLQNILEKWNLWNDAQTTASQPASLL